LVIPNLQVIVMEGRNFAYRNNTVTICLQKLYPMRHFYLFTLTLLFLFPLLSTAQTNSIDEVDIALHSTEGLRFMTKDSSNAINLRFRMQNRVDIQSRTSSDLGLVADNGFVRRMRIRSAGYLMSTKLTYTFQLGFSPLDMDVLNTTTPQIIRDAIVFYRFSPNFKIGFGQTKLPGNRQRVISSGEQQFIDLSLVNATFNIDRDFGMQTYYKAKLGKAGLNLQGAITTGEGRNMNNRGTGLAYTGRAEILPFGSFKLNGDYFEGDWAYEETPKVSIGSTFSFNDDASRTGGETGRDLFGRTDITNYEIDGLLKYRGLAIYSEFQQRKADQPTTIISDNITRFVYTGYGFNQQLSYQFRNHLEFAGRFCLVKPDRKTLILADEIREYTLASTYYYRWHRIKFQTDLTYQERKNVLLSNTNRDAFIMRFQVELGI
jgi:phosphate-selective porin OprO/OprP